MDELFIGDTVIVQFCNNSALRCKNPNITNFTKYHSENIF